LSHPKAFALDPAHLPLQTSPLYFSSTKSALPGVLRDGAPDRWGQILIKRAFRKAGENRALSEIDYLLSVSDDTRIGALRYKLDGQAEFSQAIGSHRIPPLVNLPALLNAADAVASHTDTAADIRLLLNEGSPLGGARPKSAVLDKDGSLAIAKFPKPDDHRSIPHGEVLALTLAAHAGIRVSTARLINVAGRPVALIKRFDRDGAKRIPFLSAMSLLGANDGDEATYTDIAECIRMYSAQPKVDLHELWRRIVFSVMIGNLDDHLRNHGFLYAGDGKWQLSPAYDLNPVPAADKARELSTWISEEGPDANIDMALRAAPYFALSATDSHAIVDQVAAVVRPWRKVARRIGMSAHDVDVYSTAICVDG
jgi:serine/threonine-protein kinase HipA